jgi:hypothetical protein
LWGSEGYGSDRGICRRDKRKTEAVRADDAGFLLSSTELGDRLVGAASVFEEISKRLLHGPGPVATLLNDDSLACRMTSGINDLSMLTASLRRGQPLSALAGF